MGRRRRHVRRSASARDRAARLNPFALLASQGVPLAFGSDTPGHQHESVGDGAGRDRAPAPRAARCRRVRRSLRPPAARGGPAGCATASPGTLVPGAPASYAVWDVPGGPRPRGRRARRRRAALVHRPALAGARAAPARRRRPAAALPSDGAPRCRDPWLSGRRPRVDAPTTTRTPGPRRGAVDDDADVDADDEVADARPRRRSLSTSPDDGKCPRGRTVRQAWSPGCRASRAVVGGLLLCLSFPPFGWWYLAFVAFAPAGVGADPRRPPSSPADSATASCSGWRSTSRCCRGSADWSARCRGWRCRSLEALFPALFGLLAVVVRRLPGWPVWFAGLWVLLGVAQVDDSVRRIPLGCSRFQSDRQPAAGHRALRRRAAGVVRRRAGRVQPRRDRHRGASQWWRRDHHADTLGAARGRAARRLHRARAARHRRWPRPHVRQSGAGAGDDPTVTVAAVQGNVPRLGLDFNAQRRAVLDNHVRETLRLAEDVRAGRAPQPAVRHLAGELVGHRSDGQPGRRRRRSRRPPTRSARRSWSAPSSPRPGYTRDNPVSTNTVIVWDPETGPGERHDKKIVQPFGEYLPWRSFFTQLSSVRRPGRLLRARRRQRRRARRGHPDRRDHVLGGDLRPRRPRVGAQRRPVARRADQQRHVRRGDERPAAGVRAGCGPSSTTATSSWRAPRASAPSSRPDGRELARTAFFEPAYLDSQIRLKTQLTPATRWGPIVQGLLVIVGVAALIAAMLHNGRFVRASPQRATDASGQDRPTDEERRPRAGRA